MNRKHIKILLYKISGQLIIQHFFPPCIRGLLKLLPLEASQLKMHMNISTG